MYAKAISLPKSFVVAEFQYLILFERPYDAENRKSGFVLIIE